MKKYFLSFADLRLKNAADRLKLQAESMEVFDNILIYNETDLDQGFREKYADKLKPDTTGFGYYCWKPQIIYQVLNQMNDGDILLYADVGCHLNYNGKTRLLEYFYKITNSITGILGFRVKMENTTLIHDGRPLYQWIEKEFAKGDLLDYFEVRNSTDIVDTEIYAAGIIFFKKTQLSMNVVKSWLDTFEHDFSLIDNSSSKTDNLSGFKVNRHDQSIFSILCKLNNIEYVSYYEVDLPLKGRKQDWFSLKEYPIWAMRDKT